MITPKIRPFSLRITPSIPSPEVPSPGGTCAFPAPKKREVLIARSFKLDPDLDHRSEPHRRPVKVERCIQDFICNNPAPQSNPTHKSERSRGLPKPTREPLIRDFAEQRIENNYRDPLDWLLLLALVSIAGGFGLWLWALSVTGPLR